MTTENLMFSKKDMYLVEHNSQGRFRGLTMLPIRQRRKKIHENMHLMEGMVFTRNLHYPQMDPFTGPTDFVTISYKDRAKHDGNNEALHFFLNDTEFRDAVWCNLEHTTYSLCKFDYLYTPDFSRKRLHNCVL